MSQAHIYAKIKEYLAYSPTNSPLQRLYHHGSHLQHFTNQLPRLNPQQIRTITKTQEQKILQKIIPRKPLELYEEIAKICPDATDLQSISSEEVASRLNLYNTKLILAERPTCESQSEESWQQSKSDSYFGDVRFDLQGMDEESSNREEPFLRNVFQECDNQNPWNTTEYFGLS